YHAAMPDLPPPKLVADERETLLTLLQYHRDSIVRKVEGLDEEAARRRFVPSETSLLWLLKHLVRAETLWFVHRFAGEEVGELENTVRPEDTVASAVDAYRATWKRVDAIIAGASLDDRSRLTGGEDPTN